METDVHRTSRQALETAFGFTTFRPGQEEVVDALLAGRSCTRGLSDRGREEPLLPASGAAARRCHGGRLTADRAHEGSDRRSGRQGHRRRAARFQPRRRRVARGERSPARRRSQACSTWRPSASTTSAFSRSSSRRGSRCSPSTRPIASRSGVTTSGPITSSSRPARRELGAERVLALTATATPAVVEDICAGFGIAEADSVVTGFYRPNLTLLTTPTDAAGRDQLLIDRLRERPPGTTIVYVTLQRTALRVAKLLAAAGLPARAYHAGMSADDRVGGAGVVDRLGSQHRRRDDRVRDGHRQGRRPLRLPPQPAEGARVVLPGDRPRRPRRRAEHLRALRVSGRHPDARELHVRRHADPRGGRGVARGGLCERRGRAVRGLRVRSLRAGSTSVRSC